MKFTLSWLNEHIKLNKSEIQISELLTNLGLEVESLDSTNENFKNFLVCKIVKTESIKFYPFPLAKIELNDVVTSLNSSKMDLVTKKLIIYPKE